MGRFDSGGGGGPARGGDDARPAQEFRALFPVRGEAHVDRERRVVFVLDFRFRKRRFIADAPERRAQAFVELSRFGEVRERVDDRRFEALIDRAIRMRVIAEDAHS